MRLHLRRDVTEDSARKRFARRGQGKRHCGIEMRTAVGRGAKGSDKNRQPPTRGDHDPATRVTLGASEHHVGDHAITKQDQERGTDILSKIRIHGE